MNKTSVFASLVLIITIHSNCKRNPNLSSNVRNREKASVFLTAKNSNNKITNTGDITFDSLPQPDENTPTVFIDPDKTFQTFVGIGGALTDASAETFYKLPADKQKEILTAYYDSEKGIGYSLGRTHIHSCDFSSESYEYAPAGDTALNTFSIAHDIKYRIPLIKEVYKINNSFILFASPWSPPAWMKTNNDMLHGGKLKPEFFQSWANYYIKFIDEYKKQSIPIWGLTVQNEPMAVQTWESCIYTADEEGAFVKNHLGPALWKAGYKDVKLMIWDHNRGLMYQRAKPIFDDPEISKYVWGMAYHWYSGDHFDNLKAVHEAYPDKHLFFSEGCNYPYDSTKFYDWNWGENYGRSMIHDFNNWAVAFTDWNILLDEKGGPNHVYNLCYAPIHGDTRNGQIYYMNSFYYIGHFSKFIRPGAKRISCSTSSDKLIATAFINTDGKIAVVVMNESEESIKYNLWINNKAAKTTSPAHSIMTLLL